MRKNITIRLKPQSGFDGQPPGLALRILSAVNAELLALRPDDGKLIYLNDAARRRLEASLSNETPPCYQTVLEVFPGLLDMLIPGTEGLYGKEFDIEDKKGGVFSVSAAEVDWLDGKPALLLTLRDVSEARSFRKKLYRLAYIDSLTGAPNRQKLREDFDAIAPLIEDGLECGALAIFDLDNFKNINDTYGHSTGDTLLRRLSEHISGKQGFRSRFYRLGGDEFVLFFHGRGFPGSEMDDGRAYFDNLLAETLRVYTLPDSRLCCTLSMGISLFPRNGLGYSELLRKADLALYNAKASGRNRKVFFEDSFDASAAPPWTPVDTDTRPIDLPRAFFIAEQ